MAVRNVERGRRRSDSLELGAVRVSALSGSAQEAKHRSVTGIHARDALRLTHPGHRIADDVHGT